MQGQCPKCKGILEIQQEWIERLIQCPHCGEQFVIQGAVVQEVAPAVPNAQNNRQPANSPNAKDEGISSVGAFGCYLKVLKHYVGFTGRASRKEYWYFVLFNFIISFCAGFISGLLGLEYLFGIIYVLLTILPWLAVCVRRLHDINYSVWHFLIVFIPIVGIFLLLWNLVKRGTIGPNKYGNDPYGAAQPTPTVPTMG
ncbi:MAG: DUF805 domain-containing protein [Victivallales bacterium]|nr:DUF805 domain-containing protein [Victivallales bacterium]